MLRSRYQLELTKHELADEPLVVTPIHLPRVKLPLIRTMQKSPRRIPKEYLFSQNHFSKTPSPLHVKVKYFVSKEFLAQAVEKVQHVTLVKNLTGKYSGLRIEELNADSRRNKNYTFGGEIEKRDGKIKEESKKSVVGCIGIQRFSYFI